MKRTLRRIRNILLHIILLAAVFVASVLFFMRMINHITPDSAQTMPQTTFPLVSVVRGGVSFNCMHGYAREMDVRYLRDSVTPLSSDRQIGLRVETFSSSLEAVSYEVMSLDGKEVLENTRVVKTTQTGDYVEATLSLQGKMLMNQEYVLKIKLVSGGREIYYYTNVVLSDGLHTDDYLSFVSGFSDKTINRTDLNSVAAAVEPDSTTDQDQTLAFMDIHDSVSQLTWNQLHPQMYYKPTPRIIQINTNTATLTMDYRISAVTDSGSMMVFNVGEYYRVRYTDSRVFLLNFERTTDEVFNAEDSPLASLGIRLGITGKDIEYAADEKGRNIAFVQENELWLFERQTSKLTQLFGFPQRENMDSRDFYDGNDIRILRVSTGADVYFTVAGYMNRGVHEGDNGIALYRYDGATSITEELLFIRTMETGTVLYNDVNALAYISDDGNYFTVLLEEKICRFDLTAGTYTVLDEGIKHNCYAGSPSGRYFAYLKEGEEYASSTIVIRSIQDGASRELSCGADDYIRPVCYMNNDLVYGLAHKTDAAQGSLASGYFPMYALMISDSEGNTLKEYRPEGMYIMDISQSDHMLTLQRSVKTEDGVFTPADTDEIMDTDTESSVAMGTATKSDPRLQTLVYLRVGTQLEDLTVNVVYARGIWSSSKMVSVPANDIREELYYVYAGKGISDIFVRENEAVYAANNRFGIVINAKGDYVWVRGDRETTAQIQMEKVPDTLREAITGAVDPRQLMAEDPTILDMTGCGLDVMLYYISHGRAVYAIGAEGPVAIVGYDEYNTHLLSPGDEEWHYYGINDSTAMFNDAGNIFYVF